MPVPKHSEQSESLSPEEALFDIDEQTYQQVLEEQQMKEFEEFHENPVVVQTIPND